MRKLQIRLLDNLTYLFNNTFSWEKGEHLERSFSITSEDGPYEINIDINNIKTVLFTADAPVIFTLVKDGLENHIHVENIFCFQPSSVDSEDIEKIILEALNSTETKIHIMVLGEA